MESNLGMTELEELLTRIGDRTKVSTALSCLSLGLGTTVATI